MLRQASAEAHWPGRVSTPTASPNPTPIQSPRRFHRRTPSSSRGTSRAEDSSSMAALTPAEVDHFMAFGFVARRQLFSAVEMRTISTE